MKLWLLQAIKLKGSTEMSPLHVIYPVGSPWNPYHGTAFGFVVRAETEKEARNMCGKESWGEGADPWLDLTLTSCHELTLDGESGLIIRDAHPG